MRKMNLWKRGMAILLAAVMVGQSPMSTSITYASEAAREEGSEAITEEITGETEHMTETGESPTEAETQSVSETMRAPETEKQQREPMDITGLTDELRLGVVKAILSIEGKENQITSTEVVNSGNRMDLSSITIEQLKKAELELSFEFLKKEGIRNVRGQDTFVFDLSCKGLNVLDSKTSQQIYSGQGANSKKLLGTYVITDKKLRVTLSDLFSEEAGSGDVNGRIRIPVELNASALHSSEVLTTGMTLQNKQQITMVLPRSSVEEENTEVSSEISTEVGTESSTEKNTEADTEINIGETEITEEETQSEEEVKRAEVLLYSERSVTLVDVSTMVEWLDYKEETRPDLIEGNKIKIEFSLDGTWNVLSAKTMGQLGLSKMPEITSSSAGLGVGFTKYSSQVPNMIIAGEQETPVSYRMSIDDTIKPDMKGHGYMPPKQAPDGHWIITIQHKISIVIDINQGSGTRTYVDFLESIMLYQLLTGGDVEIHSLDELSVVQNAADESLFEISGMPAFSDEKVEYIYYAKAATEKVLEDSATGDYFEPIYLNENSANFGGNTTRTHDGGTLRLILTGTTKYEMTKHWLDDGAGEASRPEGTLYLWRYTKHDSSDYTTSAQVKNELGQNITAPVDKTHDTTISLGSDLPKYDPEGYEYVYFVRESLEGSGYEQVYGEVVEEEGQVKIHDTLPDGYGSDVRVSSDKSVYNGGVLSNRRTATETLNQKKTWKASAHQNQLEDVIVTLILQRKPKGDPVGAWENTEVSKELTGFIAESMTKEVQTSAPVYDEFGKELEYRWIEGRIEELIDEQRVPVKISPAENGDKQIFELSHNEAGEDWYESSVEGEVIVNRLVGNAGYTVDKQWAQLQTGSNEVETDADGNKVYGKEPPSTNAKVTVKLLQDDKDYKTYTMDGIPDEYETEAYTLEITDLPKFDENGKKYTYVAVEETNDANWFSNYSYNVIDGEKHWDCQIKNEPTGSGKSIKIMKQWLDDGDIQHRLPVTVEVYRKARADETADKLFGERVLTAANNWWDYADVTEDELREDDSYYIKEISMGNYEPTKLLDKDLGAEIDIIDAEYHRYEVTYIKKGEYYVVQNRRIGTVNVTATKKWVDQTNEANRPDTTLKLSLVEEEYPDAIDYKTNTVTLIKDRPRTIRDIDGVPTTAIQTVVIDPDKNTSTYEFYNLPKYDGEGKIVHYKVTEIPDSEVEFQKKDYQITYMDEKYEIGDLRAADAQSMTIENRRSGTKSISFYKQWKDVYMFTRGKRPDIYLTLWKKDSVNNDEKPYTIPEYIDRIWNDDNGVDGKESDYLWKCDFGQMPKYDSNGQEITYYATEEMPVDGKAFDYTPVELDEDHKTIIGEDGAIITENSPEASREILREGGTFTNAIQNVVHITGKKVWKNVPSGFPNSELPALTILVNRKIEGGTAEKVAWTTTLKGDGKELSFQVDYHDDNVGAKGATLLDVVAHGEALEKYDKNGNIYIYTIGEEVSKEWHPDDDVSNPGGPDYGGSTYEKLPGEVNDYIITNAYELGTNNTGKLTVQKTWDMAKAIEMTIKYPVLTFELERRYKLNQPEVPLVEYSEWEEADSRQLDSNQTGVIDCNYIANLTFDKVAIFAPNGNRYSYRITEKSVDGYQTEAGVVTNLVADDDIVDITFKNTYNNPEEMISLLGEKQWEDYSNAFGIRPDKITLNLYRYSNSQAGQNNNIGTEGVPDAEFKKKIEITDTENWKYSVENLERYAPNGQPWIYVVKEELAENPALALDAYHISTRQPQEISVTQKSLDASGNVAMNVLTNTSNKSLKVTKNWTNSHNDHNLRPVQVEMKLQVKFGEAGNWTDAETELKNKLISGSVLPKEFSTDNKTLTAGNWTATYAKLPAYVMDGTAQIACYYRAVEISMGAEKLPVSVKTGTKNKDAPEYDPCWIYQPTAEVTLVAGSNKQDVSTITNELMQGETTSLKVKKTWTGDLKNDFNTRPLSADKSKWEIKVKVQSKVEGDVDFADVIDVGGDPLTKTLQGDKTSESGELLIEGLPKKNTEGEEYIYRARELTDGLGSYGVTHTDTASETAIVNAMEATALSVTKIWEDQSALRPKNISLKLLATAENVTTDVTGLYKAGVTWEEKGNEWSYTYENLPKNNGNRKEYTYSVTEARQNGYKDPSYTYEAGTQQITNTMTKFKLGKADKEGNPLTGYKFEIYVAGTNGKLVADWADANNAITANIYYGAEQKLSTTNMIYGLKVGSYVLKEVQAPVGYALAKDISFEIKADGTLAFTGTKPDFADIDTGEKTSLTVKDAKTKLYISKTAISVEGTVASLSGATLAIYNEAGEAVVSLDGKELSWTTSGNPHEIEGLPIGTYVLKETVTPEGYVTAVDTKFTLHADDSVTLDKASTDASVTASDEVSTIDIKDNQIYGNVKLVKTGKEDKALKGVKFSLYGPDNFLKDDIVTDENGEWLDKDLKLPYGSYYFVETATANDHKLDVTSKDFKVEGVSKTEAGIKIVTQPTETSVVTMKNVGFQTSVSLRKTDNLDTTKVLKGVTFTLYQVTDGNPVELKTITTGEDGKLQVALTEKGTYILKETASIYGYVFDEDKAYTATFTVENTEAFQGATLNLGNNVEVEVVDKYKLTIENAMKVEAETVTNERIQSDIRLTKTDKDETPLPGVEFEFWKTADKDHGPLVDTQISIGEEKTFVTNDKGRITIPNMEEGVYYFKEVKTLDDKLTDTDKFPENGITIAQKDHGNTVEVTMENKDFVTYVELKKVDSAVGKSPIPGVEFTLSRKVERKYVQYGDVLTSDKDGLVKATVHHKGEYIIKETKGVDGYEFNQETAKEQMFIIDNTGEFQGKTMTLDPVENTKTKVEIVKKADTGEVLPGAEFTLTGRFADRVETEISWTSSANPYVLEGVLIAGEEYELTETKAPAGYYSDALSKTLNIVMDENGVLKSCEGAVVTGSLITVVNKKVALTLSKTSAESGKVLTGWEFMVTGVFAPAGEGISTSEIVVDDKTPDALTGRLIVGNTYTIKETKAPVGYVLAKEVSFTVNKDGSITPDSGAASFASVKDATLIIKDEKTKFSISKLAVDKETGTEKALAGAAFTIYNEDKTVARVVDGTADLNWITGTEIHEITGLPAGTYTLRETKTPAGYVTAKDTVFTLTQENKVTMSKESEEDAGVSENGGMFNISVSDEAIYGTVKLVKTGKDGKPLAGVTFSLYGPKDTLLKDNIVTDGNGVWFDGTLKLPYGSYYFVETATGDDHKLDGTHKTFEIKGDSTTEEGTGIKIVTQPAESQEVTMENEGFHTYVALSKTDNLDMTKYVEGVTFTLYQMKGNNPVALRSLTTDSHGVLRDKDGALKVALTEKGTYILKETASIYGYVFEKDKAYTATFTVENTNAFQEQILTLGNNVKKEVVDKYKLTIENAMGGLSAGAGTVTNERMQSDIRLTKKGEDGTPLKGVEFEFWKTADPVHGLPADTQISVDGKTTVVTNDKGQITIPNMEEGVYYFKEVKTLDDKLTDTVKFPENGITIAQKDHGKTVEVTMENKNFVTYAELKKVDSEGQTPVAGAEFTLYKKGLLGYAPYGEPIKSDVNGMVKATIHHKGEYKIKESNCAEGYVYDSKTAVEKEFTVDNTKEFQNQIMDFGIVENEKTQVEILKKGVEDGKSEGLAGAEFTLTGRFADRAEKSLSWTSETKAYLLKGVLIAGETYTLTETKAPAGFISAGLPKSMTLVMDKNGILESCDGGSILENGRITVENEPIKLLIHKYGKDTGKPLAGCVFSVTGVFAESRYSAEAQETFARKAKGGSSTIIIDDEQPDALKGRLVVGNAYVLKEMSPPNGYEVGGEVKFTILADGSVAMEASDEYTYIKDEVTGEMKISMVDDPIEVKLLKTDEEGKPLSGGKFTVKGIFADGDKKTESREFTSDTKGIIDLDKVLLESSEGVAYTITEVEAPKGYEKLNGSIQIKVMDGGIVVLDKNLSAAVSKAVTLIETEEIFTLSIKNSKTPETPKAPTKPGTTKPGVTKPTGVKKPTSATTTPAKTGDDTNTGWLWGMLLLSAGTGIYVSRRKRRKA